MLAGALTYPLHLLHQNLAYMAFNLLIHTSMRGCSGGHYRCPHALSWPSMYSSRGDTARTQESHQSRHRFDAVHEHPIER
jgi:hypothetical protein